MISPDLPNVFQMDRNSEPVQPSLVLRRATPADAEFVLALRNEETTRRMSLSQGVVSRGRHLQWYSAVLASAERFIFLITDDSGADVGMVRIDWQGETAEVSIALVPDLRGRGLGTQALRLACELPQIRELGRVIARVKAANVRSLRMFAAQGFIELAREAVNGEEVVLLGLEDRF